MCEELQFLNHFERMEYYYTDLIEPPAPCLLCLHLGEVVIVRHKVCHDGLIVRSRRINICKRMQTESLIRDGANIQCWYKLAS